MKKHAVLAIKILVLALIAFLVTRQLYNSWGAISGQHLVIHWSWGILAVASFCGSLLTAAIVWRWIAHRMGDRSPTVPLLGAYTFSQMGKYIFKVALLLMRIERAKRFGMPAGLCTLSTLLENALYMISGALVGMVAIMELAHDLSPRQALLLWPVTIAAVLGLAAACYPPLFYRLVNSLLRKMKKPEVPREQWLSLPTLLAAVAAFLPCWIFGGLALWASLCAVQPAGLAESWWFPGAYALSVIVGMASLLPGGAGVREALLLAAVTVELTPALGHDRALLLGGAAAVLQRLFQVIAELLMGALGAILTSRRAAAAPQSPPAPASSR
jgi:uncharacterized membrane protein YbhN (UPF0104 family)